MSATPALVIPPIPGEIHKGAAALGLIAELYTETVAGHGITGRVSWALSAVRTSPDGLWTDRVRMRYGTVSGKRPEHAFAALRDALAELEAAIRPPVLSPATDPEHHAERYSPDRLSGEGI